MTIKSAPKTIQELQQLLQAISAKTSSVSLGRRSQEALAELLTRPEQAAFQSINQLAEALNISPSTLTRMATSMGYDGFNDLQAVFRQQLLEPSHFYSDKAMLLDNSGRVADSNINNMLLQVANEEINNINKMLKSVNNNDFEKAIMLIDNAQTVRTFAQRQFYSLATFFSYSLGLLRDQVSVLGESGHGAPHDLAQMNNNDLLVLFGSHPYSRITVESCKQAANMGIPTLVFSDSHIAPLNEGAQALFVLPSEGSFYSNSSGAWLVLIEAILSAYAQRLGNDAIKKLEQREQVFDSMQVTYKP